MSLSNFRPPVTTPVVDAHAHIFHQGMPLIANPRHRPAYDFRLADYLTQLDQHGIDYGVIAAASPWGDFNDYTRDCVSTTERLRGTVILHPGRVYDFAGLSAAGIVGVRLPFIGLPQLPDMTTPDYQQLLNQIADHNWHVHLHVEGRHLPVMLPILENAGPRIVIDHLGRPGPQDPADTAAFKAVVQSIQSGKSWMKVSCGYRIGPVASRHFQAYLHALGPDRLFWASDCPFVGHETEVSYQSTIDWLLDEVSDTAVLEKLFGLNALLFYFGRPA